MAVRIPRPRLIERFGSYNNLRSNPYSNSERILDVRNGVLDPYTQIAQSTLQNSYAVDSLSTFGNTFRARILGVVEGTPAAHVYPELYANSTTTGEIPKYFIFVLRDESDQFAPDPSSYATTVQSYVNTIGLQGRAISEKPVDETIESFGRGDIVEVYKPEQNSWNGAIVRKVVVRNNFSENVVRGGGAASHFGTNPLADGLFRVFGSVSGGQGGSFTLVDQFIPSGVVGPQAGIIPYNPQRGWEEILGDKFPQEIIDHFRLKDGDRNPLSPDEPTDATVRTDVARILDAVKQEVNSLGGLFLAGSGRRPLSTDPNSDGYSSRSFHHIGLAMDFYNKVCATSRKPTNIDPYLITFDTSMPEDRWWDEGPGLNPVPREPIVWAKSYLSERLARRIPNVKTTIEQPLYYRDWESTTRPGYQFGDSIEGYYFNLTEIMFKYGFDRIPMKRELWRLAPDERRWGRFEWWHFQYIDGLAADQTKYGDLLQLVWDERHYINSGQWRQREATLNSSRRYFRRV